MTGKQADTPLPWLVTAVRLHPTTGSLLTRRRTRREAAAVVLDLTELGYLAEAIYQPEVAPGEVLARPDPGDDPARFLP